nr:putative capsid protein [Hubei myriapoda virus 9]APG75932.1 hypothetical protein [Hubei myriapoda virus 9]APG75940.1 hypothetical protein [Hubei myriapoda virus 9]APG75969.1 hypothetical protein [Hubei myriapoda virus 9]
MAKKKRTVKGLKADIAALSHDVQQLAISTVGSKRSPNVQRRRRRRNRRRAGGPGIPAAVGGNQVVLGSSTAGPMGTSRVRHREKLIAGTMASTKGEFVKSIDLSPGISGATALDKLGMLFSQYKFHSVGLEWHPAVGTNRGGRTHMALDMNVMDSDIATYDAATQCQPACNNPIYQPCNLQLNTSWIQRQPWFCTSKTDKAAALSEVAAKIVLAIKSEVQASDWLAGEVWITYDVSFQGLRPN